MCVEDPFSQIRSHIIIICNVQTSITSIIKYGSTYLVVGIAMQRNYGFPIFTLLTATFKQGFAENKKVPT